MTIKDSNLAYEIEDIHLSPKGNFYFFNNFVVSEIHEGVHYTWEDAQDVIEAYVKHYGKVPITYVSNRINEYSVRPQDWSKFVKSGYKLHAYVVVSYNKRSWLNALLEKAFLNTTVERFTDLTEAIEWAKVNSNHNLKIAK